MCKMACRIVWAKGRSSADFNFGSRPIPIVEKPNQSEPDVGADISLVNLKRPECRRA